MWRTNSGSEVGTMVSGFSGSMDLGEGELADIE